MMAEADKQHVAVLGLGYVGCVSAACLAQLGHRVTGIDRDVHKVNSVLEGDAPFYEPGLKELVQGNVAAGRLSASSSIDALADADVALVCVGTPSEKNGNLGLTQLQRVTQEVSATVPARKKPLVLAIRSTVFPGTCEEVVMPEFAGYDSVSVVSNPEFLREGTAVKDFMEPSLVVIGGDSAAAVERVAALYAPLQTPPRLVSLRTAEMIKYGCNAFHALKISFANELGALSAIHQTDPSEVLATLCEDTKLNISKAYLRPGFAFGGSCLPKDLRALTYRANRLDLCLPLLESVLASNLEHLQRAVSVLLELPAKRLGVIGLAFKENTDDLRESPVVSILEQLVGKGREVRVFDPHIQMDAIYGSNRNFVLQQIPHIGRLLDASLDQTLEWADHLVIAQRPSPEMAARLAGTGLPTTDLVASTLHYLRRPGS
ncbi:MAG TPA: nucleotide sugar dehydrogenase [Bryobacteraceae bacterium]|jgi:GDP-mannose 6-dehydrogenase|nr:nucleotide sugar dehydrogenase [Bryobacteraceae bacterium]